MQQAVLKKYPDAQVTYQFNARRKAAINDAFKTRVEGVVNSLADLQLTSDESEFLSEKCHFLNPSYLGYLSQYRFNPDEVKIEWGDDLTTTNLNISGPWHRTILWEVPLMAILSESYFEKVDTNWTLDGQAEKAFDKAKHLTGHHIKFSDFGTRRRRSHDVQDIVVDNLICGSTDNSLMGTSNVYFAMKHGLRPIGTMAHEWIMGISALESLRHANRYALNGWNDVYQGSLGIALTDTFGTDAFFEDFDAILARLFDGVRHDSGDPFEFANKTVQFYKNINIPTKTKTIVFSDSLTVDKAVDLMIHCRKLGIGCAFGIGTHFTNDFFNSPALNMVIKLRSIAKSSSDPFVQVVKLSDDLGKATGDLDALRVAKYTFFGTPLDEN